MNLKRTLLGTAAVFGVALALGAGEAKATPFDLGGFSGEVQIKFSGVTAENAGTVGTGPNGGSGGAETTFSAGVITSVADFNNPGNTLWFSGKNGQDVGFFIYGIADKKITGSSPNVNIYNTGAATNPFGAADSTIHFDLYTIPSVDNPHFAGAGAITTANRTGTATLHGLTDAAGGSLLASFVLVPGVLGGADSDVTLFQTAAANTLPTTGGGNFFADCVAGPGCAQFGKNGFTSNGFLSDLSAGFHLTTANTLEAAAGWQGEIFDPAAAFSAVPEPTTLAVFGFGLVGLGAVTRRARRTRG